MREEMTNKQAMEILEAARKTMYLPKSGKYISDMGYALEKGIAALEAEPCEDAISRQAAIDAFSMFAEYESNRTNAEWVDRIRVVLSSLPPVQPISRWIPVTDKLPSDCDEDWVLVQIQEDNGYLWITRVMEYRKSKDDWWGEDIGWLKNNNGAFKVIAWMPLPEPYEPQESEDKE